MSSILKAPTLAADPTAETETFESFADAELAPPAPVRQVRTLHEPPEIWDLVPEAPKGFNRPAALLVRLTSMNPLLLALVVALGGGGALFGYMNWGNWSGLIRAASSFMDEPASKTSASLRANVSAKPPASAEPTRTDALRVVPSKVAVTAPELKQPIAENAAGLVVPTAQPVAAPAIVAENSRVKPRRPSIGTDPALASAASKRPSRSLSRTVASTDEPRRGSFTAAKSVEEKTQSQPSSSPASSAPARASATPKGKVIQWP